MNNTPPENAAFLVPHSVANGTHVGAFLRYGFIIPLVCVITLNETGFLAPQAVSLLQGALVLILCLGVTAFFLLRHDARSEARCRVTDLLLIGLAAAFTFTSLFLNDVGLNYTGRGVLQVLFCLTTGFAIPSLFRSFSAEERKREVNAIAVLFVSIGLFIVGLDLVYHVTGLSPNPRLIHPISLHTWALLAWLISYRHFRNKWLALIFAIAIVWSGSRLTLLMMTALWLIYSLAVGKSDFRRSVLNPLLAVVTILLAVHFAMPDKSPLITYARRIEQTTGIHIPFLVSKDGNYGYEAGFFDGRKEVSGMPLPLSVSKGGNYGYEVSFFDDREVIYKKVLDMLHDGNAWLTGYAKDLTVYMPETDRLRKARSIGVHNSFLRSSVLYGVPYAILVYVLWFRVFMPRMSWSEWRNDQVFMPMALFIGMTLYSLPFTSFWTNMADPPVFTACLWILLTSCPEKKQSS